MPDPAEITSPDNPPVDNISLSDGVRNRLIGLLASHDAQQFVYAQQSIAESTIQNIDDYFDTAEKLARQDALNYAEKWMKENNTNTLNLEIIDYLIEFEAQKTRHYCDTYANKLLNIGTGKLPYCIATQRYACLGANKELGYNLMPDIGMSCEYAHHTFEKQQIGRYYDSIADCYDSNTLTPKNDEQGKPLLKDGDLAILCMPRSKHYFHCIRINVDQDNKVSFSAANGEHIQQPLRWWDEYGAYVIPTSEIAQKNALKHYNQMTDNQLLEAAQQKGIKKPLEPIRTDEQPLNNRVVAPDENQFGKTMLAQHQSMQDRIAALRQYRTQETGDRQQKVAQMRNLQAQNQRMAAQNNIEYDTSKFRYINDERYAAQAPERRPVTPTNQTVINQTLQKAATYS